MKHYKWLKKSILHEDNSEHPIIQEGREILIENGLPEDEIEYYAKRIVQVLNDYAQHFGANKEISYTIRMRLNRIEVLIYIPGEKFDPFEEGKESNKRSIEKILNLNLHSQDSVIHYLYAFGRNTISGQVALRRKSNSILKDPNLLAVIFGVLAGIILLHLPEAANQIIIDDFLDPVYNVILEALSGIMGPAIFVSLTTSITSLESINDLTNLGIKVLHRCMRIILFFTFVSVVVSLFFFGDFGSNGVDFSLKQIVEMFVDIIPVNLVSPFLDNNTPQIVILAVVAGVAALLLGDNLSELNTILHQCNDWVMAVMRIVNYILPAVPFLSISISIGKGDAGVIKDGWKFILASYIIFTFCIVFKMGKTWAVTKMSPISIMKTSKEAITTGFLTSSTTGPLIKMYEASEKLHIRPDFSSFWIPMCSAMMALKTTVNVIAATLMMTQILGEDVSLSFLFVLIILTVEMSFASPGTVGSWVIAFKAFSMPTSYVGLFSTFRVLTVNYATAVVIAYDMLEQTEAAYKMGQLENSEGAEKELKKE